MERKSSISARKSSMKGLPVNPHKSKKSSKMAKKSPPKEKILKSKRGEYTYCQLKDLLDNEVDRINLYGVVLDCCGVYYSDAIQKYMCTMKIIDPTVNHNVHDKTIPEYLTATMFAKNEAQIPKPNKIGTIIRLHRAQTKKNVGKVIINCDMSIKSSWVMFDPFTGVIPVDKSDLNYTFVPDDKDELKKIRKFLTEYFAKNDIKSMTLTDAEKHKPKDFDTICYVLDKKTKKDCTRILICDAEKVIKLYLPTKKAQYISPLSIVRLRSANYEKAKKEKCLKFEEYSNILRIPHEFMAAKILLDKITSKKVSKEVEEKLDIYLPEPQPSKIISEPLIKEMKPISLKELFSHEPWKKSKKTQFRIKANVIEMGPKNPKDWLYVFNRSTKKSCKLKEAISKEKLQSGYDYYMKMQLFIKDENEPNDSTMYKIYICTLDGTGKEFIETPKGKAEPDEEYYQKLKKIHTTITQPWATLDAIVEVKDTNQKTPILFLTHTKLNIK